MRHSIAVALLSLSLPFSVPAQTATAVTLGVACAGSNGLPTLSVDQPPFLGEISTLSLINLPTVPGFAWLMFGIDDVNWNGILLPAELGFVGMPGCNLYVSPLLGELLPHSVPSTSAAYLVPNTNVLVGCRLLCQALVCDSQSGNPLGGTTSNALDVVVGTR